MVVQQNFTIFLSTRQMYAFNARNAFQLDAAMSWVFVLRMIFTINDPVAAEGGCFFILGSVDAVRSCCGRGRHPLVAIGRSRSGVKFNVVRFGPVRRVYTHELCGC